MTQRVLDAIAKAKNCIDNLTVLSEKNVPHEVVCNEQTFFTWDNIPYQQIGLYFKARIPDTSDIPRSGIFCGYDVYENKRVDLEFCWVPIEELCNIPLYPKEITAHIVDGNNGIFHFISRD